MDKLLNSIMKFLEKHKEMDEEQYEIVRYGLELIVLKVSFFAAAMVVGLIMHSFAECLVFFVFFTLIRCYAGGYHAETRIACFIMSMLTFAAVLGFLKLAAAVPAMIIPAAVLAVLSGIFIWFTAPADTENKRLDDDEKKLFRRKTRVHLCIETVIAVIMLMFGHNGVSCAIMLAQISAAVLVLEEILKNRRAVKN